MRRGRLGLLPSRRASILRAAMSRKPNLLFLMTDQQRFDTLQATGNDRMHTPNLDGLAETGALFGRCFSQAPVCVPSRCSLFSGR